MEREPLKKFYELTVADPLFAAEGLDINNARLAVGKLEELARDLERVYRKLYRWFCFRYQFTETLYPIHFLKKFLDCELQRRIFLKNPTPQNAELLLSHYSKAVKAFRENTEAYREALPAALKAEKFPKDEVLRFISTRFSLEKILQFTDSAIENSKLLENEINTRSELLQEKNVTIPQPPPVKPIPQKPSGFTLAPEYLEALSWTEDSLRNKADILKKFGPIYYELSNFDQKPTTHQFFIYLVQNKKGERRILILLADYYYFIDVKEIYKTSPIHQQGGGRKMDHELGRTYILRFATGPYYSFDLRYYADLATIADLYWRRGLNRSLVEFERSSLLDLLIQDLYFKNVGLIERQKTFSKEQNFVKPLLALFVTRSYPSICYLTFNRSIWRTINDEIFQNSIFEESFFRPFKEVASAMPCEEFKKLFDVFSGDFTEDFARAYKQESKNT